MLTRSGAAREARETPQRALRVLAIACLLPAAWVLAVQLTDERTRYSILTSAAVSVAGFFAALRLIPLTRAYTLRAGLSGLDINKKGSREGEKPVPESLGLASGVVFLVRSSGGGVKQARCTLPPCSLAHPSTSPAPWHRPPLACPQVCIILFQQLHYFDVPSLVHALRAGRWADVLAGAHKAEAVSDAWCALLAPARGKEGGG